MGRTARLDSRILIGQKAIAEYAHCSVACVRKWIEKRGLPTVTLRRGRGRPGTMISTSVFDAWLALQSPAFRRFKRGPRRTARQLWLPLR